MLTRTLHILAVLLLLWGFPAFAAEIVVVQGERLAPFEQALRGFRATAGASSMEQYVLSENRSMDIVRTVREARPRLILAVGREGLAAVRDIREIPVVYLMVARPEAVAGSGRNITGVSITASPEKVLEQISNGLPNRRLGILYDSSKSGSMVKTAKKAAEKAGIALTALEVDSSRDIPARLAQLKGKIDLLWLLPDSTVVNGDTLESIFLFSQDNRLPVVAFAPRYLSNGALAAVEVDSDAQGRQAGAMARRILNGESPAAIPHVHAGKSQLLFNSSVARNLGIPLPSRQE